MRIKDMTSEACFPAIIDVYKTHCDEIVGVVFSFRGFAEAFYKDVEKANKIRAMHENPTFATRLYRIRIKKLNLVGEKP